MSEVVIFQHLSMDHFCLVEAFNLSLLASNGVEWDLLSCMDLRNYLAETFLRPLSKSLRRLSIQVHGPTSLRLNGRRVAGSLTESAMHGAGNVGRENEKSVAAIGVSGSNCLLHYLV